MDPTVLIICGALAVIFLGIGILNFFKGKPQQNMEVVNSEDDPYYEAMNEFRNSTIHPIAQTFIDAWDNAASIEMKTDQLNFDCHLVKMHFQFTKAFLRFNWDAKKLTIDIHFEPTNKVWHKTFNISTDKVNFARIAAYVTTVLHQIDREQMKLMGMTFDDMFKTAKKMADNYKDYPDAKLEQLLYKMISNYPVESTAQLKLLIYFLVFYLRNTIPLDEE